MKISSNHIGSIQKFAQDYLSGLYSREEINSIYFYLLKHLCNIEKSDFYSGKKELLNESELLLVYDAVKELATGIPVQYLIGYVFFCEMKFIINKHVLIPRPETEQLVYFIVSNHDKNEHLTILDIGTGSGCLAVSLNKLLKNSDVFALDVSIEALRTASENALLNNARIHTLLIDFLSGQHWDEIPDTDIIVSNPPYVTDSEKKIMRKNVLDFEPALALFVKDENPLLFYRTIFEYVKFKNTSKILYLEINEKYGNEITKLAENYGISEIQIIKDFNNKNRYFCGRYLDESF